MPFNQTPTTWRRGVPHLAGGDSFSKLSHSRKYLKYINIIVESIVCMKQRSENMCVQNRNLEEVQIIFVLC